MNSPKLFSTKICGITNIPDAIACRQLGADAIGLNFYPRSLRSVTNEEAVKICTELDTSICKVGVFVRDSAEEIKRIASECNLEWIQLHGDQPLEMLEQLSEFGKPVIKALPWVDINSTLSQARRWIDHGANAVLLDSRRGKQFGGTGQPINWHDMSSQFNRIPVVLAGGLTPENVAEAIRVTRITRVDTASGVENLPGHKNHDLVRRFLQQVHLAREAVQI